MKRILIIIAKTATAISICFACLIGVVAYTFNGLFSGMCGNEIFNEAVAPDKKLKAVLFQRDCGATTGFSTQISLLASGNKLEDDDGGNIFIADGHPRDHAIELTWRSPHKLIIGNTSGLQPKKKKDRFKSVSIIYE